MREKVTEGVVEKKLFRLKFLPERGLGMDRLGFAEVKIANNGRIHCDIHCRRVFMNFKPEHARSISCLESKTRLI